MSKPKDPALPTTTSDTVRHVHPIIEIVNGYKHFGIWNKWGHIMRNFNLAAYKGEIYILLGPAGSGKSTVVNVILGVCPLTRGSVQIFGFTPGKKESGIPGLRVGYSPESSGLFNLLTVNETLRFYAKVLGLSGAYTDERISAVNDLLALPPGDRFIKHCTILEQKQVSFAIAILHEPELIVLDEPDHGVDPITRKQISEHLRKLAKSGCTVFMTSKNVLEAQTADRIGIVRGGYLLMEGSPSELVKTYGQRTVEALYIHIYSFQIRKRVEKKASVHENPYIKVDVLPAYGSDGFIYQAEEDDSKVQSQQKKNAWNPFRNFRSYFSFPRWSRFAMVTYREILLSFRNIPWMIFILLMPLLVLILINYTVGQVPTDLKLAIVNLEATENECEKNPTQYISCQVVNLLDSKVVSKVFYGAYERAEDDSHHIKLDGILIIGEKFTNQIMRTMANIDLDNVDIGNPDTSQLILRTDTTSTIVSSTLEHATKQAVEDYLNIATRNTKVQNATIGYPLKVGVPLYGGVYTEAEFVSNGVALVLLYHLAAFIAAFMLLHHRKKHLLTRDYIAGVPRIEIIFAQLLIYGVLLIIEGILMYMILIWLRIQLNNGEWKGTMGWIPFILFNQVWCGLAFGILISSICNNQVQAGCTVFCFMLLTVFLCGVIWPLSGLPDWLIEFVKYLPQTQAIFVMRCVVQRGVTSDTTDFYLGYIIPFLWVLVFILLTLLINKIS